MIKKYKLSIDRDKCIACNTCVSLLPEVFDIDDNDGLVRVENSKPERKYDMLEIDESQLEALQQITSSCPSQVFKITKLKK